MNFNNFGTFCSSFMHVWASLPRDNATRFKDLKSKSNVAIFSRNISKVVRFQIKKFSLFMAIVLFPKSWWYSLFCFHGNQFLTEFWKRQKNLLRIYVCRFYVLYWFFIKHQLNLVQTYLENSNFSFKKIEITKIISQTSDFIIT